MSESKGFLARLREFERPKSPKVIRRLEQGKPAAEPKPDISKIPQSEVEEKWKQMRQKRLSRLNSHVDEQSKLSEARSLFKITDTDDSETELRNHKPVLDVNDHTRSLDRATQDVTRKSSSSSTKKFINKFSCMSQDVSTSVEELSKETYVPPLRKSLPNRIEIQSNKMSQMNRNSSDDENFIRHSQTRSSNKSISGNIDKCLVNKFSENRNSSDYTMDIVSNEFKNNSPDDQYYPSRTVTYETFGKSPSVPTTPKISEANFLDDDINQNAIDIDNKINESDKQTEEAKVMAAKQSILLSEFREVCKNRRDKLSANKDVEETESQFVKETREIEKETEIKVLARKESTQHDELPSTTDAGTDEKIGNEQSSIPVGKARKKSTQNDELPSTTEAATDEKIGTGQSSVSVGKFQHFYENFALEKSKKNDSKQFNYIETKSNNPRSPLPLPRKISKEERILKKFHTSWVTLNEILNNESEVDADEIEAFKHTFEDIMEVVDNFTTKFNKLQAKFVPREKMQKIRHQLEDVKCKVKSFRGLKRDVAYLELSNRLSTLYFDLKNYSSNKNIEFSAERQSLLNEVNRCVAELEAKVEKNEETLRNILEEQVLLIQSQRIVPTIV